MKKQRDLVRPSLLDPYYIEGMGRVRALRKILNEKFSKNSVSFSTSHPALLLDLGGRESPYEELVRGLPIRWFSVDMKNYMRTEVMGDAEALPFKEGEFDGVLCTQVLGYVKHLDYAIGEIHRVLKPEGVAILTEAAVFPPWGEGARWRILPEGWKTLLAKFSTVEVHADCKTVASFFRVTNLYLAILLQNVPIVRTLWRCSLLPLFNMIGRWANDHFKDVGFAANYIVLAKK
jgi:SAM-dependent methyltransferase